MAKNAVFFKLSKTMYINYSIVLKYTFFVFFARFFTGKHKKQRSSYFLISAFCFFLFKLKIIKNAIIYKLLSEFFNYKSTKRLGFSCAIFINFYIFFNKMIIFIIIFIFFNCPVRSCSNLIYSFCSISN